MAPRIFTGPFEALESAFANEVRRIQGGDPLTPVNVLVGSNVLASYLKRRIVSGGPGRANVRFHTFLDLVLRLAGGAGANDTRARLPRLGASLILQGILASDTPAVFSRVAAFTGFRDALLDTFRDLRDAGVTPKVLDRLLRVGGPQTPDRSEHLEGLARLYRQFRSRVARFRDVDDDFRDAVRNGREAVTVLGGRGLLVYGVYDATGQQLDLLSALHDSLEVTYFVPFVSEHASAFARRFFDSRVAELGVEASPLEAGAPGGDLGRLLDQDCGLRPIPGGERLAVPFSGDGSVSLVSVPGESRVAVEVIREITRAASEGVIDRFDQAAVILRHPDSEMAILMEAFRLRGIPFYIHGGVPFSERPLSRAVAAIVSLASSPFPRELVLKAMELIAGALGEGKARAWEASEWRGLTNNPRFLAGADSWDAATAVLMNETVRALEGPNPADEGEAGSPGPAILRRRLDSAHRLRAAWLELKEATAGWPDELGWSGWTEFLGQRLGPLLEASEDWPALTEALDQLAALDEVHARNKQRAAVSRREFTAALAESIEMLGAPAGRFMRSGVNILPISAARGLRFPLVVIPGLEEGKFPVRLRQDPLLFDEERRRVGTGDRLPLRSARMDEEKLLFDMAVRSACRRVVLITSRLDECSDREKIPSEFFLRAAAVAVGRPVVLRDLMEGTVPGFRSVSLEDPSPRADQPAVDRAEIRLRLIRSDAARAQVALRALSDAEPALLTRPMAFDRARWQRRLTEFDGRINDGHLLSRLNRQFGPAALPYSAGKIEEYARCPYRFFLKRINALEPWEELEAAEGLDPLTRGRVVHEILERFVTRFSEELRDPEAIPMLAEELRRLALPALEHARPVGIHELLWEIETGRIQTLLEKWLHFEHERSADGLAPRFAELPFGRLPAGESNPGLCLDAGRHSFQFRGIIDRIDTSDDRSRARVIDYKVGSLPAGMRKGKGSALMSGERVQLPLYRAALSGIRDLQNLGAVEGEFLHLQVSDREIAQRAFSAAEIEEAVARLPRVLEMIGDGIESGTFFARTTGALYGDRQCSYCDFVRICGKDRQHREQRKSRDPAVLHFNRMGVINHSDKAEDGG